MLKNIKNCLIAIMLTGFFSNHSYSQEKTSWGLNIAVAQNSFRGNDYRDLLQFRAGYLVGIGNRMNITPNLDLNLNLNYELKTYKLETSIPFGDRELRYEYLNRYHFINLPVVFGVPLDRKRLWFFEMGGYFNVLFKESLEIEAVVPRFKKLDYGILSGMEKVFEFTDKMDLIIGIRYEVGLVNTAKESNRPAGIDVRTSSIKLMATWVFIK